MDIDKKLITLSLITLFVLIVPSMMRIFEGNNYVPNSVSYYSLRIFESKEFIYDSLQARPLMVNIINFIPNFEGAEIFLNIIPIILGIISMILGYKILSKHNVSEKVVLSIILLAIFSPIFIYIFTGFKIYSFIIFLSIAGTYLLTVKRTLYATISFSIIPFIDIYFGIITAIFLILYYFSNTKSNQNYKATSIVLIVAIIISIIINSYYGFDILRGISLEPQNIITDIGAEIGVSFAILILASIGLVLLWENGLRNLLIYSILILLIATSFFNKELRMYMNFILIIYAGFALIYLNRRKWSINIIKKTTMLLIICSMLFSTLVYSTKLVRSEPNVELIEGLKFLEKQALDNEVIFSSKENGYLIEYYGKREAFIDEQTEHHNREKIKVFQDIVTSRNLEKTEKTLHEYNIKYIFIDKKFETYLKDKEGLLFLLENSQKFDKIYSNDKLDIWMHKETPQINE